MQTFWNYITKDYRVIAEAVEQQKDRLAKTLQQMFPKFNANVIQRLVMLLGEAEGKITNPEDVRKSATISKFLKNFRVNPEDSAAHVQDRFGNELGMLVVKANAKGKTPEQITEFIHQELHKALPNEPPEVIDSLAKQVQHGARLQDVINTYLSKKQAVGKEDKVVYRQGNLEMIEINVWREGDKEMHLDKNKGMQACHPLLKGTKWCVRFQDYFSSYTAQAPLYLIRENGKSVLLGHKDSPWLDVNDEPPNPKMMLKIAPFVMDAGIGDVAASVVVYLPRPVQDTEAYLSAGKYKDKDRIAMRTVLLGEHYFKYENETVYLDKFDWLDDCLENLKRYNNNEIDFDWEATDEWISNVAEETRHSTMKDMIDNLDSKTEDLVIDLLNKRYKDNYYGKIKGWEDMELEEALEHDDEIIDVLRGATDTSLRDETSRHVIDNVKKTLETGDDFGFKVDTKKWVLYIKANDVNDFIRENIVGDAENEEPIIKGMNFKIPQPSDLSLDFSRKLYNEAVVEELKNLK